MTEDDPRIHLSGTGNALWAHNNPDGTHVVLLVIGSEGAYQQVSFHTNPRLEHELLIEDDENGMLVKNAAGETIIRQIPKRFKLIIEGQLTEDMNGNMVNIETVRSRYGKGKDDCGRDIEGKQS